MGLSYIVSYFDITIDLCHACVAEHFFYPSGLADVFVVSDPSALAILGVR
jgi:hypothetical protein